jgi:8-oxo-dGTP pyrophosphatase MutT (NUDIX family)
LLDELAERGLPLAVATSGHRRYATLALRTLGVTDYFQALVTGNEVEHGKPGPDIFLLAAERLRVPPARCVVLEDSPLGVAGARAAGMLTVAVPNERIPPREFSEAYLVFSSLREVHQALDDLLELDLQILNQGEPKHYSAAGGVVVCQDHILVLQRPSRDEVRLPKGSIEPGESARATALREVYEESGYADPKIQADLGTQIVTFEHNQRRVLRVERYFLMELSDSHRPGPHDGEEQFEPIWLPWDRTLATLTFEAEREWVRRAQSAHRALSAERE